MGQACRLDEKIKDFITGREVPDCDDEQIRQFMERLLVNEKGFKKEEIEVDRTFAISRVAEGGVGRAELVVFVDGRPFMALKSQRGSLVSREQESLAAARLCCPVQVPYTVVSNGRDAEILDTLTGKVVAEGLDAIPDSQEARRGLPEIEFQALPDHKRERQERVYLAFAALQCPTDCAD
ncbi:MAG: type I restriction enzyme HsdR N-terminal domain-containing protein [Pseudomonadota bacterium]